MQARSRAVDLLGIRRYRGKAVPAWRSDPACREDDAMTPQRVYRTLTVLGLKPQSRDKSTPPAPVV